MLLRPTPLVFSFVAAALGCSSSSTKPPPLGACAPNDGLPCTTSHVGGGSSRPGDSGIADSGVLFAGDGGQCGGAETALASTQECSACIVLGSASAGGFDCCAADLACSDTDCVMVLGCAQLCAVGDTACVGACESRTSPGGISAYQDFAQCLHTNCPTQCPTLTQGATSDI